MMVSGFLFISSLAVSAFVGTSRMVDSRNGDFGIWGLGAGLWAGPGL